MTDDFNISMFFSLVNGEEQWATPLEPLPPDDITFDYGRRYSDQEIRAARLEGLSVRPNDPDCHDTESAPAFEATDYEDDDGGQPTTESEDDTANSSRSSAAGSSDSTRRMQTRSTIKRQRSSDSITTTDAGQDSKRLRMTFTSDEATNPPTVASSTTETLSEPEYLDVTGAHSPSLTTTRDTTLRATTTSGAPSNLGRAPASTVASSSNQIDWTNSPGVNRNFSFARVAAHTGLAHQRDNRLIAPHEIAPGIQSTTFNAQTHGPYNFSFGSASSMPWPPPRPSMAPSGLPNPALPPGWPPLPPHHAYHGTTQILVPLPPVIDAYASSPGPLPILPVPKSNGGRGHVTRTEHAPAPAQLPQPPSALWEALPMLPPHVPRSNPTAPLVDTTVPVANDYRVPPPVPGAHVPNACAERYIRKSAQQKTPSSAPAMASTVPSAGSSSTVPAVNAVGPSTLSAPQQPPLPALPTTTIITLPTASTPVGAATSAVLAMTLPAPPMTGPLSDTHVWLFLRVRDYDARGIRMEDVNPKKAKVLHFKAQQTTPRGIIITQDTIDQLVAYFAAKGTTKKVKGTAKDLRAATRGDIDTIIPVLGPHSLANYKPKYRSMDATKQHNRKEDVTGEVPADYADRTKLVQAYPYLSTRALEQGQFDITFHARNNATNWSCPHCSSLLVKARPGMIMPHFVKKQKSGRLSPNCTALAALEARIKAAN